MHRNKEEIKGGGKRAAGRVKDKVGEWTKDPDLEAEGEAQNAEGKAQQGFGKARRKVGDKVKDIGKKIGG